MKMNQTLRTVMNLYGRDLHETRGGILNERNPVTYRPTAQYAAIVGSALRCASLYHDLADRIMISGTIGGLQRGDSLTVLGRLCNADTVREIFFEAASLDGVNLLDAERAFDALHQRLQMLPDRDDAVRRTLDRWGGENPGDSYVEWSVPGGIGDDLEMVKKQTEETQCGIGCLLTMF